MDLGFALALAFVTFLVGVRVGASRALRLIAYARKARVGNARIARFLPETVPTRSAADILAGRVRVMLGGAVYELPVLPRAASKRWVEQLDGRFQTLAAALEAAGDNTPQLMALLVSETDALYDMLLSYDTTHVLPSRDEVDEFATDAEILQAVMEVWRAAHPLAATLGPSDPLSGTSPAPRSSPPKPTGGPRTASAS